MKEKALEKTRRKIASSAIMTELRQKYTDEPEEITVLAAGTNGI